MNKILLERYKILLEEKSLSIFDSYWDSEEFIDNFYNDWLTDNGDTLADYFDMNSNEFIYLEHVLKNWCELSNDNEEQLVKYMDVHNLNWDYFDDRGDPRNENGKNIKHRDIVDFMKHNGDFEEYVEKTYLKRQFLKGDIYEFLGYYYTLRELRNLVDKQDGVITIWRAMNVPENYENHLIKQGKRLGIYWTWHDEGADVYNGARKHLKNITIEATIDEKYINWEHTLLMNCNLSYHNIEREIRLYDGTALKIKNIYNGIGTDRPINPETLKRIQGKIFYA